MTGEEDKKFNERIFALSHCFHVLGWSDTAMACAVVMVSIEYKQEWLPSVAYAVPILVDAELIEPGIPGYRLTDDGQQWLNDLTDYVTTGNEK